MEMRLPQYLWSAAGSERALEWNLLSSGISFAFYRMRGCNRLIARTESGGKEHVSPIVH